MGMPTSESFLVARSGEPRSRTTLLLKSIAVRHQIAELESSGVGRVVSIPQFGGLHHRYERLAARFVSDCGSSMAERRPVRRCRNIVVFGGFSISIRVSLSCPIRPLISPCMCNVRGIVSTDPAELWRVLY